jgi:sterol desaturase/sphingolipid hydroxylase (fatty acid hydroxylase superfamily)
MPEAAGLPSPIQIATPIFVALIILEIWAIARGRAKGTYETQDFAASMIMGAGSVAINAATAGLAAGALSLAYASRIADMGWSVWAFAACFVLDDLRFYWTHRLQHRSRWFWAIHVVHHSSQHFNLSTALRQPWFGFFGFFFIFVIPLAFLGFHPAIIAFTAALNLVYQFFIHTETVGRLHPWIEAVMNTPSHHRVHHARNPRYLDANYAGTFIIWDKLFGTFVPELDRDPPQYGLVKNIGTFNPIRIAIHEWAGIFQDVMQRGLSWPQRLGYAFAPPGWSHDRSRDDSQAIKRAYLRRNPDEAGTAGLDVPDVHSHSLR